MIDWKLYLEAIRREGHVAVACIAEDYGDGPIVGFTPFRQLREPGGPEALGFEALIDHREPYRILERARTLEAMKGLRFVGVLRACEADTAVIDFVAAGLGLPHNSLGTILARRDKAAMKEALGTAGLAHAKFARVLGAAEAAEAAERLGLPVVVKTPACASSSDVYVCSTAASASRRATEILSRLSPWGDVPSFALVEEYIEGPEYAVNLFADGEGRTEVTDVWRYERVIEEDAGVVLYSAIRSVDPATVPEACAYALQVASIVGIRLEAAHVELKFTSQGPVMVEVGARRPGGKKTELLAQMVPGWDPHLAQVRAACGRPVAFPAGFTPTKHARHLFFPIPRDGIVEAVEGVEAVRALQSHFAIFVRVAVGDRVAATTDIVSCGAFVWLLSADQVALDADEATAWTTLRIQLVAATPAAENGSRQGLGCEPPGR